MLSRHELPLFVFSWGRFCPLGMVCIVGALGETLESFQVLWGILCLSALVAAQSVFYSCSECVERGWGTAYPTLVALAFGMDMIGAGVR